MGYGKDWCLVKVVVRIEGIQIFPQCLIAEFVLFLE